MNRKISLETSKIKAVLDVETLQIKVLDKITKFTWETEKSNSSDYGYRIGKKSYETSFADKRYTRNINKINERIHRVEFPQLNCFVGFRLNENKNDEISISVGPFDGTGDAVPMSASYPRQFITPVTKNAYTFTPHGMGMLIPGNFNKKVRCTFDSDCLEENEKRLKKYSDIFFDGENTYWWDIHDIIDQDPTKFKGRPLLNMFGAIVGKSSYLAIVPTRFDWFLGVTHNKNKPTHLRNYWLPSMQTLRYERIINFKFCQNSGYVELAKIYRNYLIKKGEFKSLTQKADEFPQLNNLKGSIDLEIKFLIHDKRRGEYEKLYDFEDGIKFAEDFKSSTGINNAVVTCRCWQKWGHDIHYPHLLPPNIDCGGTKGLKRLGTKIRKMGYDLELAGDNYHDIAYESPDFNEKVLMRLPNGDYNRYNMWASGMTSFLSMPWAYKFLRRNFELGKLDYPQSLGLLELTPFNFYWIGNWGTDCREDYNPECLIDREEHHRWVLRIINYIKNKNKTVEMEHCSEWCANHLHRIKLEEARKPIPNVDDVGDLEAITIPLFQLVFNDSNIIRCDDGTLWEKQLCYGSHPKISLPIKKDFQTSDLKEKIMIQTCLNKQIAFDEMLSHEFIDGDYNKERCSFSSGITVECNTYTHTFLIKD